MSLQRSVTILTQGHLYGIGATPLTRGFVVGTPSVPVTAQKFFFDSVELPEQNVVRARFTDTPITGSGSSPTRADVVSNWTLKDSHGSAVTILAATPFIGDPEVIDLLLAAPLPAGVYTLTVAATVQGADPVTITPPLTVSFTLAVVEQDRISNGAVDNPATVGTAAALSAGDQQACEDLLQRLINPAYRGRKNWGALLAAFASGDCVVRQQAESAFDQMFLSSASGSYLSTRAADSGVGRPPKMGIDDDLFRQLAVTVVNSKLTQEAFLEMLEVFYGVDAVSAFVEFGPETYVLFEGAELNFTLDSRFPVTVTFRRSDFNILRRATALEVAAAVTRAIDDQQPESGGYAVSHLDPSTGIKRLRVYSGSRGLGSSVEITSSETSIALQPPTNLFPAPDPLPPLPDWTISTLPAGGARFSLSSNSLISLSEVQVGDYLVVEGYEFAPVNRGAFPVLNVNFSYAGAVLTQYVDVQNPLAAGQTVSQLRYDSVQFFRPTRKTTYSTTGYVSVAQTRGQSLVSIPATTQAVNRQALTAAYLQPVRSLQLDEVGGTRLRDGTASFVTALAHGMNPGDQFFLDDVEVLVENPGVASSGTPSEAFDGSGTAAGTTASSVVTTLSSSFTFEGADFKTVRDLDGDVWFIGGNTYSNSGVWTALGEAVCYRVVSETVDGDSNYQTSYKWTRGGIPLNNGLGAAVAVSQDPINRNNVLVAGGYSGGPWGAISSGGPFEPSAKMLKKQSFSPWHDNLPAGNLSTPTAEAAAVWLSGPGKFMVTGGVDSYNHATGVVQEGLMSWSTDGGALKHPRCQHATVALDATHALVIGGRQPADSSARASYGFTSWDFEDAFSATSFAGPVSVFKASNIRVAGKIGYGLYLSSPSTSSAGAAQTTFNTNLLGSWTICGWMTAGNGCVLRNGAASWTAQADNTLIAFGVDPADDKFFIRWNQSAIHNTITKKTAQTRATLMGPNYTQPYPRYHHFAITKLVSGANATFTLYINGAQAGQWTDLKPDGGSGGVWYFGQNDSNSPSISGYSGCVDAVGFTTTVLAAADVAAQYRAEVGVTYENPNDSGASPVGTVLNSCEVVTAGSGSSSAVGSMSDARFAALVVPLPDGRVVVAGGIGYNPSSPPNPALPQRSLELSSAEIFDPSLMVWTRLPPMRDPHSYCAGGYVAAENRIYVAGGFTSKVVEYLDLTTMTWGVSASYPVGAEKARGGGGIAGQRTLVIGGGAIQNISGPHPVYDTDTPGPLDFSSPTASETWTGGGLNGPMTATAGTSGNVVNFKTSGRGYSVWTTGLVTPAKAAPALAGMPGPYAFDPIEGVGVTGVSGILSAPMNEGVRYAKLQLQSGQAFLFPDSPGYLAVNFGGGGQVAAVPYVGRLDSSSLRLEASFLWPADSAAGSEVRLLASRSGFVPDSPQSVGTFYLTASNAGLAGAKKFLADVSAAGITMVTTVRYPGDRGLGGEGYPNHGAQKLSSVVEAFGSDELEAELAELREE